MGSRGEVFSSRVNTERRTYFFNVKENRSNDIFLNLVESRKSSTSDFERHSIVVYREDLDEFLEGLTKATDFIKGKRENRGAGSGF